MSPRWQNVLAFILGLVGGAGVVALLAWYYSPKCPQCGRRMVRA
jgi:hypothetical protein